MNWQYSIEAMQYFATMYQAMMKEALLKKIYPYGNPEQKGVGDKFASGNLYNSITAYVEIGSDGQPGIVVEYLDYYNYVNIGRKKGIRKVPTSSILDWMRIRGIKPNAQFKINSLAYAINKKRENDNKHKLPLDVLRNWIREKGIQIDEEKSNLALAFAIQTNIFKYGIRPTNIYDVGISSFEDQIDNPPPNLEAELELVYNAIAEDINLLLENMITETIPTT